MTAATRARRQAPEVIAASASDDLPCPIRVVIVHSVRLYREALADLLHREGRVEVVGTAASLRRADEVTRELAPDVCLVGLGAMDELDTVREFAQALPAVKLVALGVGETTAEVIAWAEAGIHGFVTQDGDVDSCIAAVEAAAHGNLTCSETVAAVLLRRVAELAATLADGSRPDHVLTRREFEILELIGQDLSSKLHRRAPLHRGHDGQEPRPQDSRELGVHRRSEAATLSASSTQDTSRSRAVRRGFPRRGSPGPLPGAASSRRHRHACLLDLPAGRPEDPDQPTPQRSFRDRIPCSRPSRSHALGDPPAPGRRERARPGGSIGAGKDSDEEADVIALRHARVLHPCERPGRQLTLHPVAFASDSSVFQ